LTSYLQHLFSPSVLGRLPPPPSSDSTVSPSQPHHSTLLSTSLRLIGAYSPWFSSHPSECLNAITFVVSSLSSTPLLVPHAARALKGLCDANRKVLTAHVGSFVQVLGGLEGKLEDTELAKVLESVASVVQALEGTEVVEPLLTLAGPVVGKLREAVEGASQVRLFSLSFLLSLH
jgi:hypothetical protein